MREIATAPQHWLSVARVALGALVFADLDTRAESPFALPAVALAVLLDVADGRLARARGTSSVAGRVIDNASDATFLALAFAAFARVLGWAPFLSLVLAFGSYGARALISATRGWPFTPSPRGHWAGIANYALALAAAADAGPRIALSIAPLVPICVALNAVALWDNLRLGRRDRLTAGSIEPGKSDPRRVS